MHSGKQIKIIKHAKRSDSQVVDSYNRPTSVRRDPEKRTRDAVSKVAEWVSELRRKKAQEATHGFQSLFGKVG